jgi:hypothetical protein
VSAGVSAENAGEPRAFVTTRWSLVLSAAKSGSGKGNAQDALAELCRTYWRPIFSFVCRRGYSTQDAQDLTQDFFVMILERNWLEHADPHRGRFRSLLLKSLQNFLINAKEKTRARKRGGEVKFVSLGRLDVGGALASSYIRGFVGTGSHVLIGGFRSSGGNGTIQLIIRALGPTLTQFGVSGALADPTLTLINGNGNVVAFNDNWKNTQQSTIQATGFAPPNDLESAI